VITLEHVGRGSLAGYGLQQQIEQGHYLRCMPDSRTSYEIYQVRTNGLECGALVFGRPEATRCQDWYGAVADVKAGRCAVTRWQVLCLSRVWLHSDFNRRGRLAHPGNVPGYWDRHDLWRSTLASSVLKVAAQTIGYLYLLQRPPCFPDEPYEIRWLLSYCDTAKHRGTIYRAAGWELYRTNERGIQTWRTRLPALTADQDAVVRAAAEVHPRSIAYRAQRAQLELAL
jgi:hypothetical protein